MKNKIGVMQGRLLPKYQGRYQAHPLGYWRDEFIIAKQCGLDCIEFILDFNEATLNPLLSDTGVKQIVTVSDKTGVAVQTICADYFMEAPLHSLDKDVAKNSQQTLIKLLNFAKRISVSDIVIPCVDNCSLKGEITMSNFVEALKPAIEVAKKNNINLSLETDLPPKEFVELLNMCDSKNVTVNYDTGNSTSLGFDSTEELQSYGEKISDIHIKDRKLGGGPVTLGEGDMDFNLFFESLKNINYQGPFIMQAYRDDEGLEIFKQQLQFISPLLKSLA